jgi:hypothetical protein
MTGLTFEETSFFDVAVLLAVAAFCVTSFVRLARTPTAARLYKSRPFWAFLAVAMLRAVASAWRPTRWTDVTTTLLLLAVALDTMVTKPGPVPRSEPVHCDDYWHTVGSLRTETCPSCGSKSRDVRPTTSATRIAEVGKDE